MNLSGFIAWALGQGTVCKHPSSGGGMCGECVSLVNQYCWRVLGVPAMAWGHAKDWATNANVAKYFDKVGSPQAGDILVYGATPTNKYGHIAIDIGNGQMLDQNGRIARRVAVGSRWAYPLAILRRKGGSTMLKIGREANWRTRFNRLHWQLVGNWNMSDATFNAIVGKDAWSVVESWSDHPNANQAIADQALGERARKDKWDQQIYSLQDQVKALTTRPTKAELDAVRKQADDLAKSLEEAQKKQSEDTQLLDETGSWLIKLFNRLFKKG